ARSTLKLLVDISVGEFISETNEDYKAPTTSNFSKRLLHCRNTVSALEEALDGDRAVLYKIKKSVKGINTSGLVHVENQEQYIQFLEKFGDNCVVRDDAEVGSTFLKFAGFTKELTSLFKNLLQLHLTSDLCVLFSLCRTKIEKEKKEHAKQHGMIRTEFSGGEIAEEMEKERRIFQLQMCEYLLKVNEIKVKKGADFLQTLIKYFHAQCLIFHYKSSCFGVDQIKQSQDGERKQLAQLRDVLKNSLQSDQKEEGQGKQNAGYSLHQLQGNKAYGTEHSGFLYKKSEGLRKVWQKRKCSVNNGYLTISHGTPNATPAKLNLLTCQVKRNPEEKKSFDLFSHDRTYHFQTEEEADCQIWISVLQNSKEEALNKAFKGVQDEGGENNIVQALTKAIVVEVKRMSGNDCCCDCGAPSPTWLSTNLGVLICIECSGIHREMGVHYSRIQSLDLDLLGTSELLLAKNVGNANFNDIMETELSALDVTKPNPSSDMQTRKDYITAKYTEHRFVHRRSADAAGRLQALSEAVRTQNILSLLEVYAEGVELSDIIPQEPEETALHLAVRMVDRNSLHIVDFLAQNCSNLDKQTTKGSTALHYCCLTDNSECLKLLLRGKASASITNEAGETALDIAQRLGHSGCEELLSQAQTGKFNVHVHVEYEWRLQNQDLDESDDEMEDKVSLGGPWLQGLLQPSVSLIAPHLKRDPPDIKIIASFVTAAYQEPPPPPLPGTRRTSIDAKSIRNTPLPPLPTLPPLPPHPPPPPPHRPGIRPPPVPGHQTTSGRSQTEPASPKKQKQKRVKAIYNCVADNPDELTFDEGEVIVVEREEDAEWWVGHIEADPGRQGVFPLTFVHFITD
uniref:ArfGAP with SH3 domain, ankyrin repeat and PH domain 2b n=1 Tax=Gadus morhua TaxID=8049 RepID=A0A8C5BZI1_GADMO